MKLKPCPFCGSKNAVRLLKRWSNLSAFVSPPPKQESKLREDTDNFLEAYRVSLDG